MKKDWYKKLLSIPKYELINEHLHEMMKIFHEAFPCRIIQLYKYSNLDNTISGVLSYDYPNIQSISHIHENLKNNSYIHKNLLSNECSFLYGSKFQTSIGNKVIVSEPIDNMILVPFSINGVVIAFMMGINAELEVPDEVLSEIQEFSDSFINMSRLTDYPNTTTFTDKELMIMKYITNGYTTKEIGSFLNITDSTVKYFVNNVMEKTKSKNRVEAVSKLFRMKLLQ